MGDVKYLLQTSLFIFKWIMEDEIAMISIDQFKRVFHSFV
jgi:hypothetical protein